MSSMYATNMDDSKYKLHRIGAGACGTVWTFADRGSAFKREDGDPARSLLNDYQMHQRIQASLQQFAQWQQHNSYPEILQTQIPIQIPACHPFITPEDSSWWAANLHRFRAGYAPCNTIHAQRIPPINSEARLALATKYCPPESLSQILNSTTNHDCLVRPYLGRRRVQQQQQEEGEAPRSRFQGFSLRNFPLHLDQMEELDIPEAQQIGYARTMAQALAIMHWVAEVDGNDVEFVLAAPNGTETTFSSTVLDEHSMWMLDFDLVRPMSMDENGVQQAVEAFWKNDPFFPRPAAGNLWAAFRYQYVQTSMEGMAMKRVPEGEVDTLPELFIRLVEEKAKEQDLKN